MFLVELSVNDQNTIGPQRTHSLNVCKYIFPIALVCANNAVARVLFTRVFFCPDRKNGLHFQLDLNLLLLLGNPIILMIHAYLNGYYIPNLLVCGLL